MSALGDRGITLEGLAAAVDALRQELATWKALAHKQDQLTADQITATQSGATAAKISQIAVNTAAIQSLAAQVAGQIALAYVTALPATGEPLTLYLVPQGDGTAPNYCNEYLWINDAWELIGTTGAMANNGELSIQVNGVTVGTFTANQAANAAVNISVPTNTNQLVNGAGYVDTAALQAALALKQNNLTAVQLDAVNSGITAAGVQQIADNATAIAGKQDALTAAQQAAVDSGATVAKIDQIASNASAIVSLTSSKQDSLSTTQLVAVNSGITAAAVQQIGTNVSNISSLQTAVSGKAADDQVVHKAGTETITGDKTWTGNNRFSLSLYQKGFSPRASAPSSNEFGQFGIADTGNSTIMSINYANRTTGVRDLTFRVYDNAGNTNGAGVFKDANNNYSFCSLDPNNAISLGNSANLWSSVYAQTYYYNGTAWGLDKANVWTNANHFTGGAYNNSVMLVNSTLDLSQGNSSITETNQSMICLVDSSKQRAYSRFQSWTAADQTVTVIGSTYKPDANSETDFSVWVSNKPNDTTLHPYGVTNPNLGNSTYKWKTLNGVNPGALSLPNKDSVVDITSEFTDLTGGDIYYIPPADGWICITADTEIYCAVVSSTHRTVFWRQSASATSISGACVTIPVKYTQHFLAKIKSTGAITAAFYPCLGNV